MDECRDRATQVEQRVQLDGSLGRPKRRPVEQAQAQVDGGRVQRIHIGIEFQYRRLFGVQRPGAGDQPLSQRMVDAPVAQVQRIGQRRAGGRSLDPHVKQLCLIGRQAGLDVAQRLAPRELCESHDTKQIAAVQRAHARIASVPLDDASEGLPRHELHDLREQRLAQVHASLRALPTREHRNSPTRSSNRGHRQILLNHCQYWASRPRAFNKPDSSVLV
jgi:hypothetical protein